MVPEPLCVYLRAWQYPKGLQPGVLKPLTVMQLLGMTQAIITLLLFPTFPTFAFCLLRAWFGPPKELHPSLPWVRAWSKRAKEKQVFQQCNVLPGHEVAAKTMLSGFAFKTALSSLGVRDKGCIFSYFSHCFFPCSFCACPFRETGSAFRSKIINFSS